MEMTSGGGGQAGGPAPQSEGGGLPGRYRSADLQYSRNSAVNNINPLDLRVSHRSAGFLQDSCKSVWIVGFSSTFEWLQQICRTVAKILQICATFSQWVLLTAYVTAPSYMFTLRPKNQHFVGRWGHDKYCMILLLHLDFNPTIFILKLPRFIWFSGKNNT